MSKLRLVQVLLFVGGIFLMITGLAKDSQNQFAVGLVTLLSIIIVKLLRFIFMD